MGDGHAVSKALEPVACEGQGKGVAVATAEPRAGL